MRPGQTARHTYCSVLLQHVYRWCTSAVDALFTAGQRGLLGAYLLNVPDTLFSHSFIEWLCSFPFCIGLWKR